MNATQSEIVDRIAKRQIARFLDRQRNQGTYSEGMAGDIHRLVKWTALDVAEALASQPETAKENCHGHQR